MTTASGSRVQTQRRLALRIATVAILVVVVVIAIVVTLALRPSILLQLPAATSDPEVNNLREGDQMPSFEGVDFAGSSVEVVSGEEPMAVVFMAHWCDYCERELANLSMARSDGTLDLGFPVVVISTYHIPFRDWPPANAIDFRNGPDVVLVDTNSALAQDFGVSSVPAWYFVDADGQVVDTEVGEIDVNELSSRLPQQGDREEGTQ